MREYSEENIITFLKELLGRDQINSQTDIFLDLHVFGDDFHEMIEKYSKTFNVDMTSYLWYFHTYEEGYNTGAYFFKAPNERVNRIPVTPKMLLDFANNGKWTIDYPEHTIPKRRYDLIINTVLILGILILFIISLLIKFVFS